MDPVDKTVKIYDQIADEWSKRYGKLSFMRDFADMFIDYLGGKKILDIGCGPGRDAKYFNDHGFHVIGIDLSEKFLEIAKETAPETELRKMDFRNIDFPDDFFDGVWVSASFFHIPKDDIKETFRHISRVIKKNGILYLSVLEGRGQQYLEMEFGTGRFFKFYSKEEIKEILNHFGFEIINIYPSFGQTNLYREWINVFAIKK